MRLEGTPGQTLVLEEGMNLGTRYRIERKLGQGGMGRVYKAYDKELNRSVAIKVLRPELVAEPEALERFKQELLLASKISHKNILRIHDLGEVDGLKFISMAYVEGNDLHQILKKEKALPLERLTKIAEQLCRALEAARQENVVHRDLKPQNILVDAADNVYVSDFGLAKSVESSLTGMTRAGAVLGTPYYMSPEQIEGKQVDHRSDIYSAGLILYEMATGITPFSGESALEVMFQHVKQTPKNPKELNRQLPDYLAGAILKCMEKDPAARYQTAGELLGDIEHRTAPARANTMQISVALPGGKKGWLKLGAAGLAVLFLLALAIPRVRDLVLRRLPEKAISANGVPTLAQGRFLAVLPFKVIGDQPTLGYIAEGVSEGLAAKLFQLKDVRMTSASEAERSARGIEDLNKVAKALGANLVVHGSVMGGGGNQIRIIVNLEDVADGKRLYSKEFSGVSGDILTIEDQIYGSVVEALEIKPSNEEMERAGSHPTEKVEAYDLYLRGRNDLRSQQDVTKIQAGIQYFEQALKSDPNFALAYTGIADGSILMYYEKKDPFWSQKALAAAQQAQRLNPNLVEVHYTLGNVYHMTGKNAEALAEAQSALKLAPNSDEAYRRLGAAYFAVGRGAEAIEAYKKAIENNPYFWVNYNFLGHAYFQLGKYDEALQAFEKITQLEPDNAFGYVNIASVYTQEGDYEKSIAPYKKALELQPHFTAYSNLGTAYYYLKRYPEAVQMFEKAVEMNPQEQMAVGNLADAYRASGEQAKANATYDKAIGLAYKELQVNPRNASSMGSLANYYAKKGDSKQAQDFMRRALAIDSSDVDLLYTNALVQTLANKPAEAVKALQKAFEKGYPAELAENDPEFQPLAGRSDYQALIKKYSAKAHP